MLRVRVITALVLLAGFSADLFFASFDIFALVLVLVVAAAAWEWSRLGGLDDERLQSVYAVVAGLLTLAALYVPYQPLTMQWVLLTGFVFWFASAALLYLKPVRSPLDGPDPSCLVAGLFVLTLTAIAVQYLRSFAPNHSVWLLLYALAVIWCMDTGAYFAGRRFGQRKLAPLISPGKTVEGVLGGLLVTGAMALLVLLFTDWARDNLLAFLVASILAALASVLGDLYESRIKRSADRKDSSSLLPGHGGVLDRLDSVTAAVPVFAFAWAWL